MFLLISPFFLWLSLDYHKDIKIITINDINNKPETTYPKQDVPNLPSEI